MFDRQHSEKYVHMHYIVSVRYRCSGRSSPTIGGWGGITFVGYGVIKIIYDVIKMATGG